MPDPALSVQDMKDYGYAWAGVLPAGQEAAEKAMEKGCEVYRLYSDNTEGLCVDAKEIADHAAKGGMLGISKESWMAKPWPISSPCLSPPIPPDKATAPPS